MYKCDKTDGGNAINGKSCIGEQPDRRGARTNFEVHGGMGIVMTNI